MLNLAPPFYSFSQKSLIGTLLCGWVDVQKNQWHRVPALETLTVWPEQTHEQMQNSTVSAGRDTGITVRGLVAWSN